MKRVASRKTIYLLAGTLSGVGCIVMVAFPAIALDSAQKGVSLWASSVLPALLPFFICANFMIALGLPVLIGQFFEKPFRKIFGAPGVSAFVFSISITSGYPMGAKLIGDMTRRKEITREDAKMMLTFCSTSGPLFMLGAVGAGMLLSPAAGAVIAISHYLGAIVNGIVFRFFFSLKKSNKPRVEKKIYKSSLNLPKESLFDIFTDSIISSFKALGIVCGYIVLFTLVTDFMQYSGLLQSIDSLYLRGILKGFFEMTVGSNSIAGIEDVSLLLKCIGCTFIISWGGLSILAQSMSMLAGLRISILYYTLVKFTHGIFSALLAALIGPFLLTAEVSAVFALGEVDMIQGLGFIYSLFFSTKMVIMVIGLFIITVGLDKLIRRSHEGSGNHRGI